MTEVSNQVEARLGRMENDIKEGFDRIEAMVRREIQEIKTEQIKELKEQFARAMEEKSQQITRLGDDQRRIWDLVHAQGIREGQRNKFAGLIGNIVTALFSGGIVAIIAKMTGGGAPPPHP